MEICAIHSRALNEALRAAVRLLFSIGRRLFGINLIIIFWFIHIATANAQGDLPVDVQKAAPATEATLLQLKPNRCVALHQGQVCYQKVQLLWSAPVAGNYCLYQQDTEQPLHCWQNTQTGEYRYEFASDIAVQLLLVNTQTQLRVAQAEVAVAWVYKANTRRQTHWRIF